jgi:hypothetical protein
MESIGTLAKELCHIDEAYILYKRVSEFFLQCRKTYPSNDVLGKGA